MRTSGSVFTFTSPSASPPAPAPPAAPFSSFTAFPCAGTAKQEISRGNALPWKSFDSAARGLRDYQRCSSERRLDDGTGDFHFRVRCCVSEPYGGSDASQRLRGTIAGSKTIHPGSHLVIRCSPGVLPCRCKDSLLPRRHGCLCCAADLRRGVLSELVDSLAGARRLECGQTEKRVEGVSLSMSSRRKNVGSVRRAGHPRLDGQAQRACSSSFVTLISRSVFRMSTCDEAYQNTLDEGVWPWVQRKTRIPS